MIAKIWVDNGNLTMHTTGDVLARTAGLAGLIAAYLALVQVVLLSRLPFLERLAGFDRLTHWHRWNGHLCIDLVIVHVVLQIGGYSVPTHRSFGGEFWVMVAQGAFPGMITATIGTVLLIAVAWSSFTIARARLPYELWYAVHITAYAGIALAWFHEIPTGGDLALNTNAANYWRGLAIATLVVLAYRVLAPFASAFRYRLRVAEVIPEGSGVTSLRITGRKLDRIKARPGQFFIWRFLTRGHCGRRIRSRSRLPRMDARFGSPRRRPATTPAEWAASRSVPASSPKGRSATSPSGPAAGRRCCSSPVGSGSHLFEPCWNRWTATSLRSIA